MYPETSSRARTTLVVIALALALLWPSVHAVAQKGNPGFVYIMTNEASENSVIQYQRGADGLLRQLREIPTGGLGSGGTLDPLVSQDSLVLSGNGRLLLAVNAGSDEVSVLRAGHQGLSLLSTTPSGGDFPNSVAIHGDLVYVLNAQGAANVTGFRLAHDGTLQAIPGSTRLLPGGAAAAPTDVRFSPDGGHLLVTESGANQIVVFEIGDDGLASDPVTQPSAGMGPFGFRFGHDGVVIVAEAASGSASSYELTDQPALEAISAVVANGQMASCWISLTNDARYAYISNTASGTISSYRVGPQGALALLRAVAVNLGPGTTPIDSALSRDGKFLYVQNSTLGRVTILRVEGAGLRQIGTVTGLPTSLQGIAAR